MEDIRITIVQTCVVVVSLVAGLHANRCRPCVGRSAVYINKTGTCDHNVTKEAVLNSLKALNYTFTSLENELKIRYNFIQNAGYSTPTSIQGPLTEEVKQRLPKKYKDRFIHETYSNISYVFDILKRESDNFKGDHLSIKNELMKVMCNLVMVNRKIYCRKNKSRPSRRMMSFKMTKVCEKRNVFQNHTSTLEGFEAVHKTLEETMAFWDTCVVENPRSGKLKVTKQCRGRKRKAKAKCSQIKERQQRRKCQKIKRKGKKNKKNKKAKQIRKQNKYTQQ